MLMACSQIDRDDLDADDLVAIPRSVSSLLARTDLSVFLRIEVNGSIVSDQPLGAFEETVLPVPASTFSGVVDEVSVLFYLPDYRADSTELPLASSTEVVTEANAREPIRLTGRLYTYADSDADAIFNVHEVAVSPRDLDQDSIDNVFDDDSDADGLQDGVDPQPYEGSGTLGSITDLQQTFELEVDGTSVSISVENIRGDSAEFQRAANFESGVPVVTPALWPTAIDVSMFENRRWTAFGLRAGPQELCPNWTQSVGTSSIRSSAQSPVLLYFRRDDGAAFVSALSDQDVADLDVFNNNQPGNGSGPLNDGLRMVLVPRGTVGWMEFFTGANFAASVCTLNVTSENPAGTRAAP